MRPNHLSSTGKLIERGHAAYDAQAWRAAYTALAEADAVTPLDPSDLELLAQAAVLIGQDVESAAALTRAHHEYLKRGDAESAARCAFWIAFPMIMAGDSARGSGWLARTRRVLEEAGSTNCVVHGYLELPMAIRAVMQGELATAYDAFTRAVEIGEQFKDRDLVLLARHGQARALVQMGRVADGTTLFDEVMIAVTANEASPMIVGTVYCSVLSACSDIFDFGRAQAWADALHEWCSSQPDLVPHRGECMVRHADLLRLRGGWSDAMALATRACDCLPGPANRAVMGAALYQQGELRRLRGEFDEAEHLYRRAHELGRQPQPGLALLRLAQRRLDDAVGAIRQAIVDRSGGRARRSAALMAAVEIMLAASDLAGARLAADELSEMATQLPALFLRAAAAHATGAVHLAEGDARGAIAALREACSAWDELEAPYEAARTRVLVGLGCRGLGDEDSAALELDAARAAFSELGAAPDLARVDALDATVASASSQGLTDRELEVLRLLSAGATNKAIAAELVLSVRTVDRHVSNIFAKLDVSSRAAATAYAHEHRIV